MKKKSFNWKYILREIGIVSAGILIAFGINTLSANIANKKEVKEYRLSLVDDIEENLKSIDKISNAQKLKVKELNTVIKSVDNDEINVQQLSNILFRQRKSPTFFPISGTFKSLVSQGNIEIFNTEVKRELYNLYDTHYERTRYNGVLYDEIYVEIYDKEIQEVLNLRTKKLESLDRLKSEDFLKKIYLIIDEAESYLKLLDNSKIESQKMLIILDR